MSSEPEAAQVGDDAEVFLRRIPKAEVRADAAILVEHMRRMTGEPARVWGTMLGFGRYRYRYASGQEGESFLAGFASRKSEFSIYLSGTSLSGHGNDRDLLLARLGKHRAGKGCLYVRRLSDIDLEVLDALIALSVAGLRATHPVAP